MHRRFPDGATSKPRLDKTLALSEWGEAPISEERRDRAGTYSCNGSGMLLQGADQHLLVQRRHREPCHECHGSSRQVEIFWEPTKFAWLRSEPEHPPTVFPGGEGQDEPLRATADRYNGNQGTNL